MGHVLIKQMVFDYINHQNLLVIDVYYELNDNELRKSINEKIKILKEKQQQLLTMRYGLNNTETHTLREMGEYYGVTTTAVDINIKTALNSLSKKDKEIQGLRYYLHREI